MKFSRIFQDFPILRGMATYFVLYPSSNFMQQLILLRPEIEISEVGRFALFGGLWVAPSLYTWVKLSTWLFPKSNLRNAIKKVCIEQITYSPFAITTFYFGMNMLQGKGRTAAVEELKIKFWPTYKMGLMYWPVVQTVNFSLVPEKNRVPVVAMASFLWVAFLSFMKHQEIAMLESQTFSTRK